MLVKNYNDLDQADFELIMGVSTEEVLK